MKERTELYWLLDSGADVILSKSENLLGTVEFEPKTNYMIYLTAIGLTPSGSSTVHIYKQTVHSTIQSTQTMHRTTQFTN